MPDEPIVTVESTPLDDSVKSLDEWKLINVGSIDPGHKHTGDSLIVDSPEWLKVSTFQGSSNDVASFTISGLDLDTDLGYKIVFFLELSKADTWEVRLNGNNTGHYVNGTTNGTSYNSNNTGYLVYDGTSLVTFQGEIVIRKRTSGVNPIIWSRCTGITGTGPIDYIGCGLKNSTANITSVVFQSVGGTGANWTDYRGTLYKLS